MQPSTKLRIPFLLVAAILWSSLSALKAQCPISFVNTNQSLINLLLGANCSVTFDASTRVNVQGTCDLVYFKDVNLTIPYNGLPSFDGSNLGQTIEIFVSADDANPNTALPAPLKFTLKIVDTEKPIVNCPFNQAFTAEGVSCSKTITSNLAATAFDNCGGSVSLSWISTGQTSSSGNGTMIGASFNVGRSIINYTATDASNNKGTCSFTIDINEIVPPVLVTCPSDLTLDAVANACERIVVVGVTPSYSDNCTAVNNLSLAYEFSGATEKTGVGSAANAIFKVGKTLVNYTASDAFGNKNSACSFSVTIKDIEKPQVICPSDLSLNTRIDSCFIYISATNLTPVRLDNCGQNNLTTTFTLSGAAQTSVLPLQDIVNQRFVKGMTSVTYTVSDAAGNTNSCTQKVIVSDKTAPKINCISSHITTVTPNGECQKLVALEQPSSSDNCTSQQNINLSYVLKGAVTASGNGLIPPNQLFVPGLTTVTYRATDENGNFSECSYNVTVIEVPLQKPTLQCPADVSVFANTSSCNALINNGLQPKSATDNCTTFDLLRLKASLSGATVQADSLVPVSQGANGFRFNVGTTKVRYILTDASDNKDTCYFNVLVIDNQRPVITCTPDMTLSTTSGCARRVLGLKPNATDNCSPNNLQFSYTLSGATTTPVLNQSIDSMEFQVGITTVKYKVIDAGNNVDSCKFDVTIIEGVAPTVICPNDLTVNTNETSCAATLQNIPDAQINDNCTALKDLSLTFSSLGASSLTGKNTINGQLFNYGKTTVTYTVSDFSNNTAQCSFSVSVKDAILPKITCPSNFTVKAYDTTCYAFVKSPSITFSDNCTATLAYWISEATTTSGNGVFEKEPLTIGKNTVTYRATDKDGNSAQCAFDVFVKDVTAPKITCPSNVTLASNATSCAALAPALSPVFSDNCTQLELKYTASGVTNLEPTLGVLTAKNFNVGKSIVTFSVSDIQNNTATCSLEIAVLDQTKPIAKCRNGMSVALDMTGNAYLPAMVFDNGSSDNCTAQNDLIFSASKEHFSCADIGANSVNLMVKDAANNSETCTATLTIVNSFGSILNLNAQAIATTESYWGATNGAVGVTVNGGLGDFEYLWNNGATTASQGDLPNGKYFVTITDKVSRCSTTASATLEAGPKMKLIVGNLIGVTGSTVLVPVRVQNFNKIKSLQFQLNLMNKNVGTVEGLENFGINSTDSIQYSVQNGLVSFKKLFPNTTGMTLANGTALFYIRVKLTATVGTYSTIDFNTQALDFLIKQFLPTGLTTIPINIQNGSVGISNGASTAKINGKISREDGVPIKDANVYLSGTYVDSLKSKADGAFQYELPLGAKATLKTKYSSDVRAGLNAIDAMILQRHILGYINMNSEYKKLAADVNKSGTLTALDVAEIKRVILGYQAAFRIPTWQFVPADYVFPSLDQNQVLPAPDSLLLPYLLQDQNNKHFVAIKAGDLNLSANPNFTGNVGGRNDKTITLVIQDKELKKGEIFNLTLKTEQPITLAALQAAIQFDASEMEVVQSQNVDLQGFNENDLNLSFAKAGDIRLLWTSPNAQNLAENSNILSLQCRALKDINSLKTHLYLNEKTMPAIGYAMEEQQHLALKFVSPQQEETPRNSTALVYPNPADAFFTIAATKASAATLYDVEGRVVGEYDLSKQHEPLQISTSALPTGLYILKIQEASDKIIKTINVVHF